MTIHNTGIRLSGQLVNNTFKLFSVNQCNLFCNALEKPDDAQALPIRCKRFFNLESFSTAIANLEYKVMKRIKKALTVDIPKRGQRNEMFYEIGSLLFIKEIKGMSDSSLR